MNGTPQCKEPGCLLGGGIGGYCRPHYTNIYRRTSDGTNANTGKPKLNAEQVAEIKRLHRNFKTNHAIAKQFGVCLDVVRRVIKGEYTPQKEA